MDASDPRHLAQQYGSDANLAVRWETHRKYGAGDAGEVFVRMTRRMVQRDPEPTSILDVGAGTGNWYRAIRSVVGPVPYYTALDQSPGMVERVAADLAADARASAAVGDAQRLPFPDASFGWVGMHFMLYHVPNIALALQEAWRVLTPGGLLAAATNGPQPYRELWEIGQEAADLLGRPPAKAGAWDRFHLDNGALFFPTPPDVERWPSGFRFPAAEPVVRYMASGPIRTHLASSADDPAALEAALAHVRARAAEAIARDGVFTVHSETGFFLLQKPQP